eukprot:gene46952-62857_t
MGYSSIATARAVHETINPDASIAGTTRSEENIERLADSPYRLHVFDGTAPGATLGADLRQATHLVLSIPPNDAGDPALNLHRADLDAAANLQWICYYSTVGVYGDFGGEWIDETATTRPINKRSKQRVEIEQQWRDYAASRGIPLMVLRLAGIYGPGRSSFDKLREGHRPGDGAGGRGSRAVLEVRSREVPFILEDGQIVGRLVYERMLERPSILYGSGMGSNYQGQSLKLSKHFR